MKEIIFIEHQKNFNAVRLGLCLARALQENGHEIILAGRKGKLPLHAGIKVHEFGATAKASTLAAAFTKEKATRVISFTSLPACEAAAEAKLPYIYVEPENFKEEKAVKNKKTILKKAQKVVVIGTGDKALDKKQYGSNAVRVKNPAIAITHDAKFKPTCFKKQNNVVAIAQLGKEGGVDGLLKVWAQLAPLHHTWHLTIWGEGPSKRTLQNFISKNHLQCSTELVGPELDLADLLRGADIYVNPSKTDNGLDYMLDAMASRLPVLAADLPKVREYISPEANGLTASIKEDKAWCCALDRLMSDWGKRVGLALEAEKTKSRFPAEVFISLFEE